MYLMFYYDIYKDVRLVGTPPASIGAFGGDYDNWGWPQHKGDFALYRVYADREGALRPIPPTMCRSNPAACCRSPRAACMTATSQW